MANLKLRYFIIILLLAATASVVSALQYDSSQDETAGFADLQKIPMQIGNWQGQDLPLDESVYEILETRAILHRNYTDDQENTVLLSIVHYHDTKVDFHAPEACLGGRGKRTSKKKKILGLQINNKLFPLEVAEIVAFNSNNQSLSYYFYQAGKFMGQNYITMRLNLAKNSLLYSNKSGSLIRVSVTFNKKLTKSELEILLSVFLEKVFPFILKSF